MKISLISWLGVGLFYISTAIASATVINTPNLGIEVVHIGILKNVPTNLTIEQVSSGQAGSFENHSDPLIHHASWNKAFWLRLVLQRSTAASISNESVLIELKKSYLDVVKLYSPNKFKSSGWDIQIHGDTIKPSDWTHNTLHPRFELPKKTDFEQQPDGKIILYLQVEVLSPVVIKLETVAVKQAHFSDLQNLVLYGVLFGAIVLTLISNLVLASIYRDQIYIWCSALGLCSLLCAASYSALGHVLFWPTGGAWPGNAVATFSILSCACQLGFVRCISDGENRNTIANLLCDAIFIFCLIASLIYPWVFYQWHVLFPIHMFLFLSATMTSAWLLYKRWRAGSMLAKAWFFASIPLFIITSLAFLEGVNWIPSNAWPIDSIVYITAIEIAVMGLVLQWFSRKRHGQIEHAKALASLDPLTGFVNSEAFQIALNSAWQRSESTGNDIAIALIDIGAVARNNAQLDRILSRSARVIRAATRSQDTVGRIDGRLVGIIMLNASLGKGLAMQLSRIVAFGLMSEPNENSTIELNFKVVAATRATYGRSVQEFSREAREVIMQKHGWAGKTIRYIGHSALARSAGHD